MAFIDSDLELLPWWGQTATSIAPCAPATFSASLMPARKPSLLLQSAGSSDPTGKLYPGVLFSPGVTATEPRPILPNSGTVTLAYDVWVSGLLRNLETDLILVQNGLKFNGSLQRSLSTGEIDVGNWTDTGLRLDPLRSNERYGIQIEYVFAAKSIRVASYVCDGVANTVAEPLATQTATACNWLPGAYVQLQLASFPAGNAATVRFRNIRLVWNR